jgi:hypothetical protein
MMSCRQWNEEENAMNHFWVKVLSDSLDLEFSSLLQKDTFQTGAALAWFLQWVETEANPSKCVMRVENSLLCFKLQQNGKIKISWHTHIKWIHKSQTFIKKK